MKTKSISRRQFLGSANCALVSAIPVMNTLLKVYGRLPKDTLPARTGQLSLAGDA